MTTYVTRDEVLATWGAEASPTDADALDRIDSLIEVASAELDQAVGHTFERGTSTTLTIDGDGGQVLHLHGALSGLASLASVSFLDGWAGASTLIASGDYLAETWDRSSGQIDHIVLGGSTSGYGAFPKGRRLIQLVGEPGFPSVPANVKEAVASRVRQLYHADPTLIGGVMGPEEGGRVTLSIRPPDPFWRAVRHFQSRYAACYL